MDSIQEIYKIRREVATLNMKTKKEIAILNNKMTKEITFLSDRLNKINNSYKIRKEKFKQKKAAQREEELKKNNYHGYDIINGTWCREHDHSNIILRKGNDGI